MSTSVQWRNLVLGSAPGDRIVSIEGWEGGLPPTRYDKTNRARGHGSHPSPVWADERTVTVTGTSYSAGQRDALLIAMQNSMALGQDEEPLTVTLAGRTLTASAQLLRFAPAVATGTWNMDLLGWVAMWRCTDPLRYGPTRTVSTGLPTSGGGLTYPLTYPLAYGTPGAPGMVTLANAGNADAGIVFTVQGGSTGLPAGFDLSAAGQRLTYPTPVVPGETITIDTTAGTVLSQGTGDRRGQLTNADWMIVPKARDGGTLTVQFSSLGGTYDPAVTLTAQWGDTWW